MDKLYDILGITFASFTILLAAFPTRYTGRLGSVPMFLSSCVLTLFVFRWPILFVPRSLNPDEAQMIAQALTLERYPIPWVSYDGTTSGPLNSAVLALSSLVGHRPDYFSTRVIGLLLIAGAMICLYLVVRREYGEFAGRLATIPVLLFFSTVLELNFVHYSSEHLSLFLIGLGGLALVSLYLAPPRDTVRSAALVGVLVGALLFAKIQSAPLAFVLAVASLAAILLRSDLQAKQRRGLVLWLAGGIITAPVLILGLVIAGGGFRDFWISYILTSLQYGTASLVPPSFFIFAGGAYETFIFVSTVALLAGLAVSIRYAFSKDRTARVPREKWLAAIVPAALLVAAVYTVLKPHEGFAHYLLWLVFPLAALVGCALGLMFMYIGAVNRTARIAVAVCLALPFLVVRVHDGSPYLGSAYFAPADPVVKMLQGLIKPGDRVAIWGWMPQYLVETGAIMGTRDSIGQNQIDEGPYQSYYLARYVHDLETNRPAYFVDAVAPQSFDFTDRARFGHEQFLELARIIAREYHLVGAVNGVRLYARNGLIVFGSPARDYPYRGIKTLARAA